MNSQNVGDFAELRLCNENGSVAKGCKRHSRLQNDIWPRLIPRLDVFRHVFRLCPQFLPKFGVVVWRQEGNYGRRVVNFLENQVQDHRSARSAASNSLVELYWMQSDAP